MASDPILFSPARVADAPVAAPAPPRTAIIDIGSNSIRLVIYQGPARLPQILFNEKVMAGLGRGLAATGQITPEAMTLARGALSRFAALTREVGVARLRTVATAAVRDAANGQVLLDAARELGLDVELLSGEQEAVAAGHGVLSAIPEADGIVGDLGGGSLELVRVRDGSVGERVSFPLGVLRLGAIRAKGKGTLERRLARLLADSGWTGAGAGLPLYLVGGSWRTLARLDMYLARYPLPILQHYAMSSQRLGRLIRVLSHVSRTTLKRVPGVSGQRAAFLPDAAALLCALIDQLGTAGTIVSSFGLREGLLYGDLDAGTRRQDPLIVAAREEGRRLGRFAEHGDLLDRWVAPLFGHEEARLARLRHAACLLADVGWAANPDFRAERGVEIALHGNWVAIDACGRAVVAQALFTSLGGGTTTPTPLERLAPAAELKRAVGWGLAMRLGQRLSAGVAGPLERSRLTNGDAVRLRLPPADRALYADAVVRRHQALAQFLGKPTVIEG